MGKLRERERRNFLQLLEHLLMLGKGMEKHGQMQKQPIPGPFPEPALLTSDLCRHLQNRALQDIKKELNNRFNLRCDFKKVSEGVLAGRSLQ